MRWEKLTVMSQEAFREAQAKAGALGHPEFGPVVSPEAAALLAERGDDPFGI